MEKNPKQLKIKNIIFDADNTLWDWAGKKASLLKKIADILSEKTNIAVGDIRKDIGMIYKKNNGMHYDTVVNEMETMKGMGNKELSSLSKVIEEIYKKNELSMYPGTREVFKKLKEKGVKIHIVTDAQISKAKDRIMDVSIGDFIETLSAQRDSTSHLLRGHNLIVENKFKEKYPKCKVNELINKKPVIDLSKLLGISKEEIKSYSAIIGDNKEADGKLAEFNNTTYYHAAYGEANQKDIEILESFGLVDGNLKEKEDISINTRMKIFKKINDVLDVI